MPEIEDFVISVNAKFGEKIPSRAQQFRAELATDLTPVAPWSCRQYLIYEHYIDPDDSCLFQVTRSKFLRIGPSWDKCRGFWQATTLGRTGSQCTLRVSPRWWLIALPIQWSCLQGAIDHADTSVSALSCGPLTGIEEHSAIFYTSEERDGATVLAVINVLMDSPSGIRQQSLCCVLLSLHLTLPLRD